MQVDAHYSLLMIDGSFPNTFIYMHILSIFMQKIRLKSSLVTKIRHIKVAITFCYVPLPRVLRIIYSYRKNKVKAGA